MRSFLIERRVALFIRESISAIATAWMLLTLLAVSSISQSAFAQDTRAIPPPPPASGASFDPTDPKRAFSPTTGQNFHWDCNKNTWIDSKTGESAPGGFEGRRDSDGAPIPPPPPASGASFDPTDPKRAFSPTTGQNMHWDPDQQTWRDSKTGQPVPGGFKGRRVKDDCPPPAAETTSAKPSEEPKKVEEKKEPSWWESLIPALIPSIGIGGGRDRERREPRNPCAGK